MISWFKKHWEWAVGGLAVLLAFLAGRKGKEEAEEMAVEIAEIKEEEVQVEKELNAQEKLALARANKKYINTMMALKRQQKQAKDDLEKKALARKAELLEAAKENPDELDRLLLEEFGIGKV